MGFVNSKSLEEMEEESQQLDTQLEIEQKKALIKKAKAEYGNDWKRVFSGNGKNFTSGIDWESLKFRYR